MKKIILLCLITINFASYANSPIQTKAPTHIKKVLVVMADDAEAAPIIKTFNLSLAHTTFGLPMEIYKGKYANKEIELIVNGKDPMYGVQNVGTEPATLATYVGIKNLHPDLVLSVGTAGGLAENGAKTGDIYISQKIYFYDRRIPSPGYREYGLGGYPSWNASALVKNTVIKYGVICSGNSFDNEAIDTKIFLQERCSVREMEAAGVAWVSMLLKTPMFAMKGITDQLGDKNGLNEYRKNLPLVCAKLADNLKNVLKNL